MITCLSVQSRRSVGKPCGPYPGPADNVDADPLFGRVNCVSFQDLKLVYQKKLIPLLDLFLDSWPFVLAVVFLLFCFFDAR